MSTPTFEQLEALQKAVPYLLKAIGVETDNGSVIAGICDIPPNEEIRDAIIINFDENKQMLIASRMITMELDCPVYYIRCNTEPDKEQ